MSIVVAEVLKQISVLAALVLAALALIALLQTMALQGKKRIVGGVATLVIVLMAVGASTYTPSVDASKFVIKQSEPLPASRHFAQKQELTQESGIQKYAKIMQGFSNEMSNLAASISELSKVKATSEMEAEKHASKALSIKERSSKFFAKLQRSYKPSEAESIHSDFVAAAEHLRLAAFALHAFKSSEDKAFRDLQSEQLKEQLKLAKDQWDEVSESLSKLSPEFFNNQP